MPKYLYKAKDRQAKTVKGEVEAKNRKQAALLLKERDLIVFSLSETRESETKKSLIHIFQRVGLGDLATFTRQVSTMITAGLTLPEALDLLKGQTKPALSLIIEDILNAIEAGASFAEALKKHEQVFGKVYIALVTAGEAAGVLDEVLARLADNLEKQKEFRGKIKGAMIYPVIILFAMIVASIVVMVVVIPQMMTIFTEFGTKLPLTTRILIGISGLMSRFWWLGGGVIVGVIAVWRWLNKTKATKRKIDALKLKLPVFGKLQKQIVLLEMVRTLSLLIGSGISLVEALNIISEGMENLVFQEGLIQASAKVEKGISLAFALGENENFPLILTQMASVGEQTGKLDEVLFKVSSYFESESEEAIKGLTAAIEPMIMILLGLGVGFLMIAIILPMYQLTATIQ